jgi:hypothetical protein
MFADIYLEKSGKLASLMPGSAGKHLILVQVQLLPLSIKRKVKMRDIKRIKPDIKKLEKYWRGKPDLRFCQLIIGLFSKINERTKRDIFYIEDEEFFKLLEEIMKGEKEK